MLALEMLALEKEGRKFAGFGKGGEEVSWLWKRRGGSLLALEKEGRKSLWKRRDLR